MRIAVVNLTAGGLSGGYRKYLRELVPRLAGAPGVEHVEVLLPEAANASQGLGGASVSEWPRAGMRATRGWIRRRLEELDPGVVFIPTARFISSGYPTVVMVRNMEPLAAPFAGNSVVESLRNIARRAAARRACSKATKVIAVSDYVAAFVRDRWGIPSGRVAVVPHGVSAPREELPRTARPPGLGDAPDIFTAGSVRPARGLEDLFAALLELRSAGARPNLAIAGSADRVSRTYAQRLQARAEQLGLAGQIRWLGHLESEQMSWCYRHCRVFAMTSRVEACPNVALEAMAHGAICVSSDNPPLPEFFADAANYYPAGSGAILADLLRARLSDSDISREQWRERARRRAADFSWDTSAARTLAVLRAGAAAAS